MQPIYKIEQGGIDISGNFNDRLLSMTVVQHAGDEADTLDIELDDRGSQLAIPPKGKTLEVFMGFSDVGVTSLGTYIVDNIVLDWSPAHKMIIKGKSADLKKPELKEHRNMNYENKTLQDVASDVAGRAGLDLVVASDVGSVKLGDMLHQTDESDMNLLRRLSRDNNALFKVAGGKLIMSKRGASVSASGESISITVLPTMVKSAKVTLPDRGEFTAATASAFDFKTATRMTTDSDGGQGGLMRGFIVRHQMVDVENALQAAKSRKEELDRTKAEAHVELSVGNPNITASGDLTLANFRDGMNGTYTITSVEHAYDSSGYTTKIDGEQGNDTGDSGTSGFGADIEPIAPPTGFNPDDPDDPTTFEATDATAQPEAVQPAAPYTGPPLPDFSNPGQLVIADNPVPTSTTAPVAPPVEAPVAPPVAAPAPAAPADGGHPFPVIPDQSQFIQNPASIESDANLLGDNPQILRQAVGANGEVSTVYVITNPQYRAMGNTTLTVNSISLESGH